MTRAPRYAIIISGPLSRPGGSEIQALALARHLALRGFDTHVITRADGKLPSTEKVAGFSIHRIFCLGPKLLRFTYYVGAFFTVIRLRPYVVHGIMLFPNGLIGSLACFLLGRPLIVHSVFDVSEEHPLVRKLFYGFIFRSASVLLVKADAMKAELIRAGVSRQKLSTINNGIELQPFALDRSECRRLISSDPRRIVLYVGRLDRIKGIEYLLKAYAKIRDDVGAVEMLIVGDGPDEKRLKQIVVGLGIGKSVRFCGRVGHHEVPRYFVASDVFVLPSLSEGCPNVVLEALAAGLPVLASAVGGVPELVRDGKEGFLVVPGDFEIIADRLRVLLLDEGLRREMSYNSKKRAQVFEMVRANDQIFELGCDLICKRYPDWTSDNIRHGTSC